MVRKNLKSIALSAVLAAGLTAGHNLAVASDAGIIYKQAASEESNYCHIKYMAMTQESLQSGVPEFNPSDIVDMYGPCDFDPKSPEEVRKQVSTMNRGLHGESGGDSSSGD
ncbi:MAG: hypothetical protein ACREPG_08370 [Candidatus Binatia bacterium]